MPKTTQEPTITEVEATDLAYSLLSARCLRFTNKHNKALVKKKCTELRIPTFSRTAHGSLLDPRYTVEGAHIPDLALSNDYKHYHPKLYVLEHNN